MFRLLKENEISVRVQSCGGKSTKQAYAILLLYKDARVDQAILDETFGMMNWQNDYQEIKGNLYCTIRVWDDTKCQWISKQNCGVESNTEAEKGEASDSFKRACFNLGIGRELYSSPSIFINLDESEVDLNASGKLYVKSGVYFKVRDIGYDENRNINKLVIVDKTNEVRFSYENGSSYKPKAFKPTDEPKVNISVQLLEECKRYGVALGKVSSKYGIKIEDLTEEQVRQAVALQKEFLEKIERKKAGLN